MDAATLFENTMDWLREQDTRRFRVEDDVVLAVEAQMKQEIKDGDLPYRVAQNRPLTGGIADLAIFGADGSALVAAEFKFEPHRSRLTPTQSPRVAPAEFKKDLRKVQVYVGRGRVPTAYSILVDEDGRWRSNYANPPEGSEWRDWGNGVWALWTKRGGDATYKAPPAGATDGEASSKESHETAAPGDWVPLPDLNVNLPPYAPPPAHLRFPDGDEHPVKSWKDMLYGTACWLASVCKLTERDAPVPVDARQPQARQRYIVSASSVHGSGKPFDEPFSIPDTTLVVETMVDKAQAKAYAIKLLRDCGVDPGSVLVLR